MADTPQLQRIADMAAKNVHAHFRDQLGDQAPVAEQLSAIAALNALEELSGWVEKEMRIINADREIRREAIRQRSAASYEDNIARLNQDIDRGKKTQRRWRNIQRIERFQKSGWMLKAAGIWLFGIAALGVTFYVAST